MTTENTTTTDDTQEETSVELVPHPLTGEAVDLASMTTTELGDLYLTLTGNGGIYERLAAFKKALIVEATGRMDRANTRSERVGNYKLTTNAPTEDTYSVDVLEAELVKLVDDGKLDRVVLDRIIVTPEPVEPSPRVDKREVNKLKTNEDPAVLAALARARVRVPTTRTLKIEDVNA